MEQLVDKLVLKIRSPLQDRDDEWKVLLVELEFYRFRFGPYGFAYKCIVKPPVYSVVLKFPMEVNTFEENFIATYSEIELKVEPKLNCGGDVEKIEVNFAPTGSINSPLRGVGLMGYIFSRFIQMVQEDLKPFRGKIPIKVLPLRLSFVDASEENRPRRDGSYRKLGWTVRTDESGEGIAFVRNLWDLAPHIPPSRYGEVRGVSVEEVTKELIKGLKEEMERVREQIVRKNSPPTLRENLKFAVEVLKDAVVPALIFLSLPVLLPTGMLRMYLIRRKRRW